MIIDDGYTMRARLMTNLGRLVLTYRPMLLRERTAVLREMRACQRWEDAAWAIADRGIMAHVQRAAYLSTTAVIENWSLYLRVSDFVAWQKVFEICFGVHNNESERRDAENLASGVPLLRKYGHLQNADTCRWCQKWMFDPSTGETEIDDEDGSFIPRWEEAVLACHTEEGCPNGSPEKPQSLSSRNRRAFVHYQECVAINRFPEDAIVRRNAAIIRAALSRRTRRAHEQPESIDIYGPVSG